MGAEEQYQEYETLHIIDYVNIILKRRWLIVWGTLFTVALVGIISFKSKPVFTASAKFLPSKNPEMSSRMGTLVGGGIIKTFEDNVTSEYYMELMKSRDFLARIAAKKFKILGRDEEMNLIRYYEIIGTSRVKPSDPEVQKMMKTIEVLSKMLRMSVEPAKAVVLALKFISLSYSTNEPELSAAIVNAIMDDLVAYNQDIRGSEATQNRKFIENQLKENQNLLKTAEKDYSDFMKRNVKITGSPDLEVERDRLKRAVTVQAEVYITLRKQLELAMIEEQEKKSPIEIIERAAVPLKKSAPQTLKNAMLAGFVSLILFVGLAFVMEYIKKIDPNEERNREFFGHLRDIKNDIGRPARLLGFRKKRKST